MSVGTQPHRVVLPGGSGFLGRVLAAWFCERGWDVVVLSRQAAPAGSDVRYVTWNGETIGDWVTEIDGARAVVNLAGRSVNCRYHARNRRAMMDSRINSTRILGEAIAQCSTPPSVWLNSSTATIYKHSYDTPMDEATGIIGATAEANDAFSVEIGTAWERALDEAPTPHTRKSAMRTAMVFGADSDSVFAVLRRLTRLGLGGRMGTGRQYVSWIHERDFCRAVDWLIERDELARPVNVCAPNPVTNAEMMRLFRLHCHRSIGLPATRWMLEIGAWLMRTETELILKSRRVVPRRLRESGFAFEFETMDGAILDLCEGARRPK